MKRNCYEPFTLEVFKNSLRQGMKVLDIGANVGFFSLIAARAVGESGIVYAFEPDPRNKAYLEANILSNGLGNVRVVEKAVAESSG